MKVFLIKFSYHKPKWSGRFSWPDKRIIAESQKEALELFYDSVSRGYGLRLDSIEDVTGKPHKIPSNTVF